MMNKTKKWAITGCALVALSFGAMAADNDRVRFDISSQNLAVALNQFALQSGKETYFIEGDTEGFYVESLQGYYDPNRVLDILLEDTGLSYWVNDFGTVLIGKTPVRTPGFQKISLNTTEYYESNLRAADDSAEAYDVDTNEEYTFEEIVVSATKRDVSLQRVPLSITALTESSLKRLGADRFADYLAQAPGVTFDSAGIVNAKPTMRGISTSTAPGQGQSAVGIYIDDLPSLSRAFPFASTDLRTFDVERIEILRGPQGTLFGSGSAGGAIRIITKKPNLSEYEGKVEVGFGAIKGGDITQNYNAMVNVPIVENELALRVVGYYRNEAGYIDNFVRGEEDTGSRTAAGGRAVLQYTPTERLTMRGSVTYQKDKQDTAAPLGLTNPADGGIDENNTPGDAPSNIELSIYNFSAEYDFDTVSFLSSSSYGQTKARLGKDNQTTVQGLLGITEDVSSGQDIEAKTFSQEIRLASEYEGPFQWLIGGFYLDQDFDITESWTVPALDYVPVDVLIKAGTKEMALFGEVSYDLTDQVTLTAGGRLFENKGDFYNRSIIFGGEDLKVADPSKESSITPRFSIAYKPTDDLNFYATASKGYRVGRSNFTFPADPETGEVAPDSYDSDSLWNYEIGMKSRWFDRRLTLNVAAYHIDWKNIQLSRQIGDNVITDNAGDAESDGIEVEVDFTPYEWLNIGGAYAYTDAELVSVLPGTYATPGSVLPATPKNAWSSHIQLTQEDLFADVSGYLRLDHKYIGERFQDLDNEDSFIAGSYHKMNLRAGFYWDSYEVVVYAENLTNERELLQFFEGGSFDSDQGLFATPRTIGITFRADF